MVNQLIEKLESNTKKLTLVIPYVNDWKDFKKKVKDFKIMEKAIDFNFTDETNLLIPLDTVRNINLDGTDEDDRYKGAFAVIEYDDFMAVIV